MLDSSVFSWILNPWWDLLMLTIFAYHACSLQNCPNSQAAAASRASAAWTIRVAAFLSEGVSTLAVV